MEIQDIHFHTITKITLSDFGEQTAYVSRFIEDKREVYFYARDERPSNDVTGMSAVKSFLGEYNLNAKIGDTCRLMMRSNFGYPSDDPKDVEYMYQGFYLWEGVVTKELLRESSIRIGSPVRKVLIEKFIKKPEEE
jgi:hypothetical protein